MNYKHGYYLNLQDGLEFAGETLKEAVEVAKLFGNPGIRQFVAGKEVKREKANDHR